MVKPIITSFSQITPITIQQYERYLPTAFDESLSLLQKVNKVIEFMNRVGEITNEIVEQWNVVMEWVMNEGLEESVSLKLEQWLTDGTLDQHIVRIIDELLDMSKRSATSLDMLPDTDISDRLIEILSNDDYKDIEIVFKKNATYKITKPITIDLYKYSIDGNGAIFEFSISNTSLWGITLTSSYSEIPKEDGYPRNGGSPAGNIINNFKNLILQTPRSLDKNCNGLFFNNIVGKSAHIVTNQIGIFGFNKGVGFGNNAYMITNHNININYCNTCVSLESGYSDMGERISFDGGCIGDSNLMILNTTDQALHFHNISFDFSNKFFENTGQIYINNCHIEAPERYFDFDDNSSYWGVVSSTGSVFFNNCRMLLAYGNTKTKHALFHLNGKNTFISFNNIHTHIFASFLTSGDGTVRSRSLKRYNDTSPMVMIHDDYNMYKDPNCEYVPSNDEVYTVNTNPISITYPSVDNGYVFTHLATGYNSRHYIKLPTRGLSGFRIYLDIETQIVNNFFFNFLRFVKKVGETYVPVGNDLGSFQSIVGVKTLGIKSDWVMPLRPVYDDIYLMLNTFQLPNGTTFKIKNIKVIPTEN